MKRILSVLILLSVINPAIKFDELVKMPHLLEHFGEHPELTFFEYLQEHYNDNHNEHEKEDKHDDGCLPFQNNNCFCQTTLVFNVILFNSISLPEPALKISIRNPGSSFSINSEYLSNIWHPPKIS